MINFVPFFVDYLIDDYCLLRNTAPRYQTKKYISQQCIRGQTRGFWASQGKIIFKNLQYYILKKNVKDVLLPTSKEREEWDVDQGNVPETPSEIKDASFLPKHIHTAHTSGIKLMISSTV